MRLLPAAPQIERPPRIRVVDTSGDIEDAEYGIELANAYLLKLYDWQEDVVASWLARSPETKKYVHPTCGLILPRQNGKTKGVIGARMLIGAVFYGEKIRYSAHRVATMLEMWEIFVNLFGDPRLKHWDFPELHEITKRVSLQNGHLFISLKNGGVINFVARSTGSGRGNTVDVNIYDEAQYMTETQLTNALPSQSASPSGNPQVIYVGTPPDYIESTGEVFGRVRENVLNGASGICWHEWSVDKLGDVSDKNRWYETNPSLGYSLLESAVVNEFNNMSPESFALERLALWSKRDTLKAIDEADWEATIDDNFNGKYEKYCVGIKFAPNGAQISMSVAMLLEDGSTYCELVKNEMNTTSQVEFINWIVERQNKIALVAIDGKSGADELHERLIKRGINRNAVKVMGTRDVVSAATMLNSSLEERTIKHHSGKVIDESAKSALKRKIGSDGYGFGDNSIPLESLSFANWAVRTTKRTTERRKMRFL